MSTWLTARELAGLPGMPGTERRTRERLTRLNVPCRPRSGRGGGQEFDACALPAETRRALMIDQVARAGAALAANAEAPTPQHNLVAGDAQLPAMHRRPPSQAERAVADARLQLVNQLREMEPLHGIKKAAAIMALQLASGQCTPELKATARAANQRARHDAVSDRTLHRWLASWKEGGWSALLPAQVEAPAPARVGDDVAAVLALYHSKDAQFRNLSEAAKEVAKRLGHAKDTWHQLYARARRALPKVDKVNLIKSRHSGSERAALLPFRRRDTSVLKPLDVWVVDGHTFKAKVRHPDHGAPFAPELTAVIDGATRKICGWSVALSENVIAVGDALRHAVGNEGIPAIIYSDNGAGETAKQLDCPVTGIIARLGSEHRTGLPGNPQARGLIERSWATWAIPCAAKFATFQGKSVDAGTLRKVSAELAKEQRALRRAENTGEVIQLSQKAPSWQQFIDAVRRAVHEYNTEHRHRSLPKHTSGPLAGKHMTPSEAWEAMLDREQQFRLSEQELRMLFMPAVLRTAKRGEVQFFNQVYSSAGLMAVDGEQVRVHYDIHNPDFVLIFDTEGSYVCQADWNANRKAYFSQPVVQMARERRVEARVKRLQGQMDLAHRELTGVQSADVFSLPEPAAPVVLAPTLGGLTSSLPTASSPRAQMVQATAGRPSFFDTPSERYEWLMGHRDSWDEEDAGWVRDYASGDDYASLADYYASRGIDWKDGEAGFKSAR